MSDYFFQLVYFWGVNIKMVEGYEWINGCKHEEYLMLC